MSFLSVRRIAQSAVVVSLVAGGIGFANLDKSVNLSVDGKSSAVHVFGSPTVGDVLTDQDIKLSSHDLVSPAVSTPLAEGQKVVVRYGRLLTVTVDGKTKEFWTTSTTVAGALDELGIRADSAKLSVSRAQPLGRLGLAMSVTTPKNVVVSVDGKTKKATTTSATVADALSQLKVKVGAKDRVSPALKTAVRNGQKVVVQRVTQKSVTHTEAIAFGTQRRNDSSLYTGTTKTRTEGRQGSKRVNHLQTFIDGKLSTSKFRASRVTKAPVTRVLTVGTKSRPAPAPAPAPAPSAPSSGGGSNENGAMWDRIAECESGGNWSTDTGNGYYGGLQFDNQTWSGAGGDQYGATAAQATREQQIEIANKVYADRGLQPWQCGWAA